MKKILPVIIAISVVMCLIFISSCRKQQDGPMPPPLPPTPTATPAPYLCYDFEGSLDGWNIGGDPGITGATDVPASSVPGGTVVSGSYCVQLTCSFPATAKSGEFEIGNPSPSNLQGKTLTINVFLPSNFPTTYSYQLYIFYSAGSYWSGTTPISGHLTPNTWSQITYLMSSSNYSDVTKIGIQIVSDGTNAWSGNIYIDDVTAN